MVEVLLTEYVSSVDVRIAFNGVVSVHIKKKYKEEDREYDTTFFLVPYYSTLLLNSF